MAKLTSDESAAMLMGYEEGERIQRSYRPCNYINPHPWASPLWEAFEFGYYLQEKGWIAVQPPCWQRGRGRVYRHSELNVSFKLHYGKGKNSFGISRMN